MRKLRETSLDVYFDEVLPTLGARQKQVLNVFFENPGRDFSNMELAEYLNWSINRVTPRTYELRGRRILTESRKRKCGVTGRRVWAWKIA